MGQSGEGQLAASVNTGIDETKLRAAMMLFKVFLQHLTSLSGLPTFSALWLSILDLIGQFSVTASTDILADALPESLKNMLLVMDTNGGGLFFSEAGVATPLWGVTWGKIDTFKPGPDSPSVLPPVNKRLNFDLYEGEDNNDPLNQLSNQVDIELEPLWSLVYDSGNKKQKLF